MLQTKANMLAQKPPPCTGLAGTPLPFKVPVLKASTKNPGLTPLTPPPSRTPESRASNKNNRNLESKRKASAKRAQSERKTG